MSIVKKMWWALKLPERFPILAKIAERMKTLPVLWNIIELTPIKHDYVITLPKDKVIELNESIKAPHDIVLPSQIVEYFVKKAESHFILNFCICRYSCDCKNYPIHYGCLLLGESVKKINPKMGILVSKEVALNYVKKCQDVGLVHLIGKAYPDRIGLGASPSYRLMTICNCCECCCALGSFRYMPPQISKTHKKMPGVELEVTSECIGCGTCTKDVCFIDAIQVVNKRAVINDDCKGCGRCVLVCPQNAIKLTIDKNTDFIKESIEQISLHVDVS